MVRRFHSKFRARKTKTDGITFDSQKEAMRYLELKALLDQGKIKDLKLQFKFDCVVNDQKICYYLADFVYLDSKGKTVVEDVKSEYTAKNPVYRLKKKLVEALHDVVITEVK
jgi:hypothetical protein